MKLSGIAALHLAYIPYATHCISPGGLFLWKRDTGPDRAYSLDPEDYPRLPLFKLKGAKGSTAFSTLYFGSWLTRLVNHGGVCRNSTATLPTWLTWPIPCKSRFLLRWELFVLHSQRCQRFPRTWSPTTLPTCS